MIDNIFCQAAAENVSQAPPSMSCHDDQIGIDLVRKSNDARLFIGIIVNIQCKIREHVSFRKGIQFFQGLFIVRKISWRIDPNEIDASFQQVLKRFNFLHQLFHWRKIHIRREDDLLQIFNTHRLAYYQDWRIGSTDNLLSIRTDQYLVDPTAAFCSHDDQINVMILNV